MSNQLKTPSTLTMVTPALRNLLGLMVRELNALATETSAGHLVVESINVTFQRTANNVYEPTVHVTEYRIPER